MAIRDNDTSAQNTTTQAAAPAQQPQSVFMPQNQANQPHVITEPGQARPSQGNSWNFSSNSMAGPLSPNLGSDSLIKLRDKINERFKEIDFTDLTIRTLALDNQTNKGLYYSSIILCMQLKNTRNSGVAFYTMLLTSTNEPPASKTENILGKTFEITIVPGEAFDDVYVAAVTQQVQAAYPQSTLYNTGGTTVPDYFNTEDPMAVNRLIANAATATYTELKVRQPDFVDINLNSARGDNNLQVSVNFDRTTLENAVGEPMRSDVEVRFTATPQTDNNNASLNNQARRADTLGRLTGFIDTVWAPVQNNTANNWGVFQNPQMMMQMTQKYAARFVITHMESAKISTLPAYLLVLLTALPVGINSTWYHAFFNQSRFDTKGKKIDFTDIGALNIEANLPTPDKPAGNPNGIGQRVDMRSKEFTPELFGMYMSKMFRDGLIYSVDVPLCGPQTWYLDVFRSASEGNQDAYQAILAAANQLTNGNFEQVFSSVQGSRQIFPEQGNIVYLGYYEDTEGRMRDIRDIDHLAVLNAFGETDMSVVRKWSDSFLQTNVSLVQRLSDRKNIIMALTNNRAVITGIAERVTFSTAFLESLSKAAEIAGLRVKTNTPTSGLGTHTERGVASFVNQALLPNNYSTVFQQPGMGMAGNMTNHISRQYSRYGN